jgi:hypothetical protein
MYTRQDSHINTGWGEWALAILLALILGVLTYLAVQIKDPIASGEYHPVDAVGEVMDIEAAYGPVNQDAASEVKDGLFSRVRERRAQRVAGYSTPALSQRVPMHAHSTPPAAQPYVNPEYTYTGGAQQTSQPEQCSEDGSCLIGGLRIIRSK